jgi:hypothetical protein
MSSLDIAPCPEGAPTRVQDQCRTRRRLRVSFRRAGICTFWRLGFRQSSFHHIARVSRRTVPDTWTWSPVSWHALVPLTFQRRVSHQTQGPPSNPSRLKPGIQRSASRRTAHMPMCVHQLNPGHADERSRNNKWSYRGVEALTPGGTATPTPSSASLWTGGKTILGECSPG